jgi:fluoride exporter
MFRNILFVAAGGAIGSVIRYAVSLLIQNKNFPYATLAVNIIGCFFIGLILGHFSKENDLQWRLLLATGICGGFTTFSAFSAETLLLIEQQRFFPALIYISVSIVLGVTATFAAFQMTK